MMIRVGEKKKKENLLWKMKQEKEKNLALKMNLAMKKKVIGKLQLLACCQKDGSFFGVNCQGCYFGVAVGRLRKYASSCLGSIGPFFFVPEFVWKNFGLISCMMNALLWILMLGYALLSKIRSKEDVELNEDVIQIILSGCPVLCGLTLRSCWGFKCLKVNSESLDELWISDSQDKNSVPWLEISAPYLQSLYISFCPKEKKLQLRNVPSLVSASIHFNIFDNSVDVMDNTMELFEKIQQTKDLTLGGACVEVLSELVVHGWRLPQSSRRDCLILNTWRDEDSIPGILALLESSPNIDTLVIECCDSYEKSVRTWGPAARNDLDCDLLNLKIVRLFDYADPNLGGKPMLTIARILLKRATALEEMVIDAQENLTNFSLDFTKMSQAVLSYPRSSEKAVVVLRQ